MNEAIIEKLFLQYQQKGFLTNDEIFTELISSNVSIVQTERICSELLSRGVLISDSKPKDYTINESKSFDYDKLRINCNELYDKAQIDYDELYDKIILKDENLRLLVDYVRKIKPAQRKEVENLYPQIKSGNQFARNRLFEMNMRSVLRIAYQKSQEFKLSLADTIQDGMIGLHFAIDKFNMSQHDKFQGYSTYWILNYINRNKNIMNMIWNFPVHYQESIEKIYKYLNEYHADFFEDYENSETLITELCEYFCSEKRVVKKLLFFLPPTIHFCEFNDLFYNTFEEEICNKFFCEKLNKLLDSLKEKERAVIKYRFGLWNKSDSDYKTAVKLVESKLYKDSGHYDYGILLTLEEVGCLYGVTRERIRQIETKGLKKLREKLKAFGEEVSY